MVTIAAPLSTLSLTDNAITYEIKAALHVRPDAEALTISKETHAVSSGVSVAAPLGEFTLANGVGYYLVETIQFNGDPVPAEHMEDALKLEADAKVDLFEIILPDGMNKVFLKQGKTVTWQGNTYEGTGIKIEGVAKYADDTLARPKVTIFNPNGVYNYLVDQGVLDSSLLARYRILKEHLTDDLPIYERQQWKVSRIASVRTPFISLELRDMMDGQNFQSPGRMFIPPDFPTVSLS